MKGLRISEEEFTWLSIAKLGLEAIGPWDGVMMQLTTCSDILDSCIHRAAWTSRLQKNRIDLIGETAFGLPCQRFCNARRLRLAIGTLIRK